MTATPFADIPQELRRRLRVEEYHRIIGDQHPNYAVLVVEVAGSSLHKDRGLKSALYARSVIPEYWIVNVDARLPVR